MGYKCIECGINDVLNEGDVCEFCAMSQDPYMSFSYNSNSSVHKASVSEKEHDTYIPGSGKTRKILIGDNTDRSLSGYEAQEPIEDNHSHVPVMSSGQVASLYTQSAQMSSQNTSNQNTPIKNKSIPATAGIVKNVHIDKHEHTFYRRIFDALFFNIPYMFDDDITMFQVFPDFMGSALNSQGNACDQIIVYGTMNAGAISDNNSVEIYGKRDSHNNIVAGKIRNKDSGVIVQPNRLISPLVIRMMALLILLLGIAVFAAIGVKGIVIFFVAVFVILNLPLVLEIVLRLLGGMFKLLWLLITGLFKR